MNIEKLRDIEAEFFEIYPKGFEDEKLLKMVKKFNPQKLEEFAKTSFQKENFSDVNFIVDAFFKTIQKCVMVSLFDKLKLRDMIKDMSSFEKDMLSIELQELVHGDFEVGFEGLIDFLSEKKMAKWTVVSTLPYALNRQSEYFIKPTTTKMILKYFDIDLVYKPTPTYEFYKEYKKVLDEIRANTINENVKFDNAAFTGFLKMGIEICDID